MRMVRYEIDGGILKDGEAIVRNRIVRAGDWLFTVSAVHEDGGQMVMWQTDDYGEAIIVGETLSRQDQLPLTDRVVVETEAV